MILSKNGVCWVWYIFVAMFVDLVRTLPCDFSIESRELSVLGGIYFCRWFWVLCLVGLYIL